MIWEFFNRHKMREKNHHISIFGFQLCSQKKIEECLKICTSNQVYSQIWLNLHKDDCHHISIFGFQ